MSSETCLKSVEVSTGARLHFGILSYKPDQGRHFGGVGLLIDNPGFRVCLKENDSDQIIGHPTVTERVTKFVSQIRSQPDIEIPTRGCEITVDSDYPFHAGLGSGTQLGMAVAKATSAWCGETDATAPTLAKRVKRGVRSAIGIHGFERGGFWVDAGHNENEPIGAIATHTHFPEEWRFLLVLPSNQQGLYGSKEVDAFAKLPAMSKQDSGNLCRIVLTELLPAVRQADFDCFSAALYEFGERVGRFFSPAQGGTFCHPSMAKLVDHLRQRGISGVGQSSWGPTIFALLKSQSEAEQLQAELSQDARWTDSQFWISAARNRGADVRVTS